ncbi:iron chelate uptake ABC transporter family permease subunit [Rhodobacterales bacterium LSUCC0387]|nr:iron chelate uptake ABC transporter family permease subunit [Rhodobacterales bacterium LSUCC0387]
MNIMAFTLTYNVALVMFGAGLLGVAAGVTGTFMFLRKRALLSDAISHATLPGLCGGFMVMVALGGSGRALEGLLLGSAVSAALGLLAVNFLKSQTRLSEDAAIGAVLSSFFGLGVVMLTVIQNMSAGRQAGLDQLLLGSTAAMLREDAEMIAIGAALVFLVGFVLHRAMTLTAFDENFARALGLNVPLIDAAAMALVLAVTVAGLKIVGLILIVALLIIPPVTARLWSNRAAYIWPIAGAIGGASGLIGAGLSSLAPDLPTGAIIVLVAAGFFLVSFLVAPARGALASAMRHRKFQRRVHRRQGLLALAQGYRILEPYTRKLLQREGYVRADGVMTERGQSAATAAQRDEARVAYLRSKPDYAEFLSRHDGLSDLSRAFTRDELAHIDTRMEAAS